MSDEVPQEEVAYEEPAAEVTYEEQPPAEEPVYETPAEETTTEEPAGDTHHGEPKAGFVQKVLQKYLPQVLNSLSKIEKMIQIISILVSRAYAIWDHFYARFEKHLPDQIIKCATGLVLMFFGGFFITLVACIEAFRQGGSDRLFANIEILREEARNIAEANEQDNQVDDDGDGIADVLQISKEELTQRKLLVFVRACDPSKLSEALAALYTCFLAIIATLRVKFARTISLGAAIGDNIYKPVKKYVIPGVEYVTSKDYHKWYPSIFGYICRAIGASIAFQIQRILSTVATSVRGGHMVIESTAVLAEHHNVSYLTDGYIDDILVWILVVLGIYFQIFVFTFLPEILKLILLPFFIIEFILQTLVATVNV